VPKLSIRVQKVVWRTLGKFEEQNKVLWPYVFIINYSSIIIIIIIITITNIAVLLYSYFIIQLLYYISSKDLLEDCDKEENVAVTVAATASV